MSLESNLAELRKELETGERNSKKAYRINVITSEITEDVEDVQPEKYYVKNRIVPLFQKALEVIKTSSSRGGFGKHMQGFVNSIKRRKDYLMAYSPILEYTFQH
ncbi:hypothetical protein A3K73_07635 [Candidatus Pacearchaeota archaeon RBG_13_36_9]|nr:MAG: hypothetical protein A3K73_07635 [Candidatus Pacearchaeota archaeon RBG_13_36_9]